MRRSLVRSTVLLVLLAVIAVAVPIALFSQRAIHDQERYHVELEAERVAEHLTAETLAGNSIESELSTAAPSGTRLDLRLADGRRLSVGPTQRFPSEITVIVDGPDDSLLTLATSGASADDRTRTAFIVIGATSLFVVLLAGLLAWWEARRLTR